MNTAEQLQRIEAAMKAAGETRPSSGSGTEGVPEPIAIVGLAGYFPGCRSVGEYWRALDEDRCLLEEIPADRFDWRGSYDPSGADAAKSRTKWGGFIPDIRSFDPVFFGFSMDEANAMDPRERLLLMAVYHALEDAGYAPASLRKSRTGVFVAGEENEYQQLARERNGGAGTGSADSSNWIPSRISHCFDFRGPSEFVNALCAGGAVALNRAVGSLRAGEVTAAVVGAVNVILRPEPFVELSNLGLLSPVCAVHSFGAGAQGFLRSEGVVSVFLKRLAQAEADGDRIYAVIRHTAVSHNGRGGASATSADPISQADLIRACCEQAGIDVRRLEYFEAQGMGNPATDLAEWQAFGRALNTLARKQGVVLAPGRCLVGTLKPVLGHMEAASSLGALLKLIRGFQTQTIYGIHGFSEPHPELDLEGHACRLAAQRQAWPRGRQPRLAGLNSYGMGGNNAHILVEEYVPRAVRGRAQPGPSLILLSAPTEAKLAQVARALAAWAREHPDADPADVAYTLQVGRDAMDCRLALVVESSGELVGGLESYLAAGHVERGPGAGGGPAVALFQGRAGRVEAAPPTGSDWAAWGRFWVAGGVVPWSELHRGRLAQRLSLPNYPFERCACWLEGPDEARAVSPGKPVKEQVGDRLRSMLGEALGVEAAGIDPRTHFFELGIGSLAGLRLAQRLGRLWGVSTGLKDWLAHPTVEAFSEYLAGKADGAARGRAAGRQEQTRVPMRREHPLSECQRGLWALQKMRPEMAAYHVPLCVRIRRRIDAGRFGQAGEALLERHPLLGCAIGEREGRLVQVPAEAAFSLEEIELASPTPEQLRALMQERLRVPFELETGPLLRIHLVHCGPEETILLIVAHHLIMDGLSAGPVLSALLDAYLALDGGPRPEALPEEVDFGDFVRWEQEQLAGASGQRLEAYWQGQLAGAVPRLQLTADRPGPACGLKPGEVVSVAVPKELLAGLQGFARAHRVSLPTLYLGVWQALLHRYSREDDIVVGVVTQVRPDDRFAGLVGYFINLLPIRTRAISGLSFAALAQSLHRTLAEGIDHAAYPFPRMVRALGLAPDGISQPLVQAGFEYQSYMPSLDLERRYEGRLPLQELAEPRQAGELELVLEVVELAAGTDVHFKFDPAAYEEATVRRMAGHFLCLAREALGEPAARPGAWRMLSAGESAQVLMQWNDTRRDYPRAACIHELIRRQARETPDKVAVGFEQGSMTYRELDRRSELLAGYLQHLGVKPDEPVALGMERSPEMVVALLGILKAGAAYLPLDGAYPAERLAFMVRDSGATILLTQSRLQQGLEFRAWGASSSQAHTVVEVDRQWAEIERVGAGRALESRVTSEHLAYLIYTSGTTGNPKGVMIPHRAVVNFLSSMQREPGLSPGDRLLAVTSLSFDIAGLELFLPLVSGAECWVCPSASANDADKLRQTIDRVRPTVMQATPSTWRMLLQAGWHNEGRMRVLCGGEALPEELARAFIGRGMEAWNMYGPTETTIWSTVQRIEAGGPAGIGRPIANTRVYIVDGYGQPVPVGVIGELLIAGDGLARGYWNRPELTASKFVALPLVPGERAYRTGDLACWRADGSLQYLGRADHQVKVHGHRIEVEEIECRLNQHPGVQDSAVVAREHQGTRQLVAYYVPAGGNGSEHELTRQELRGHLERYLPAYMVPAFLVPLAAIPLTPNGKKDRKALLTRRVELPDPAQPPLPANAWEASVLAIWREVLGVANLRPTEAFFEAGGDSVSAVRLAREIQQQLKVPFTTTELFRYPTARAVAEHIGGMQGADVDREAGNAAAVAGGLAAQTRERGVRVSGAEPCPEYYRESLAIIGISCQFPGAESHQAFWANLRAGVDSAVYFTREELLRAGVPEDLVRDPAFVPVQRTIEGKDCFDPDFFRIPAKNAALMDPQMRLLLMHAWQAIEDAGYVPGEVGDAGVFTAVSNTFYASLRGRAGEDLNEGENYVAWLLAQEGTVATTISYHLGLRGPSYGVHANCSSSLVALHSAWQTIRQGLSRYALVGAASLVPQAGIGYRFQEGLNLSSDGRCKAFDAAADGMVGGEGAAVLLVKRADLAVRDGDHIYALVRGVGVNNDGAAKAGFYAPGLAGQVEVIEQVLKQTGIAPGEIGYVEAHGTGTKLGDPVEVAALSQVYGSSPGRRQFCGLGSVKSNIGHLDTAAGLAGCIKTALSLKHGEMPPSLHYRQPNPAIDFANSPFYVVDRLRAWRESGGPRRAGLSCLGIGGTNTHAILEESLESRPDSPQLADGPQVIVLSARNQERLRQAVANLGRYVAQPAEPVRLGDLAFTLQVGRVPMERRLALVAGTMEELQAGLQSYLAGDTSKAAWWEGTAAVDGPEPKGETSPAAETIAGWMAGQRLAPLAQAWVQGAAVDWRRLQTGLGAKRISLPTYPFARERYWIAGPVGAPVEPDWLHPLVHRNNSTLAEHRYRSSFTGTEFFLADHVVQGRRIMPGVAYLELARAAVGLATGNEGKAGLRNVAWLRPWEVSERSRSLQIALRAGQADAVHFEIAAVEDAANSKPVLLCQGEAVSEAGTVDTAPAVDLRTERYPRRYSREECYAALRKLGIDYGPSFQGIVELYAGAGGVLARLALPSSLTGTLGRFGLHPALLDAALHASVGFSLWEGERGSQAVGLMLPFALEALEMPGSCEAAMWVRLTRRPAVSAGTEILDLELCDPNGRLQVRLAGLCSRETGGAERRGAEARGESWLVRPVWLSAAADELRPEFAARYVVVCNLPVSGAAPSGEPWLEIQTARDNPAQAFAEASDRLFQQIQSILQAKPSRDILFQVVVPGGSEDGCLQGLSGLLRTTSLENPRLFTQLIAVEAGRSRGELHALLEQSGRCFDAVQSRYREGHREVMRLEAVPAAQRELQVPWRDGGIYLITGGTGGLGLIFAAEIGRRVKDATVILVGRSELDGKHRERLTTLGVRWRYYRADVSHAAEVASLTERVRVEVGPLNGVLHAAGQLHDDFILRKTAAEFQQVLAAKVAGTVLLDRALGEAALDFFVLFSSVSGVLGSVGQVDYAAGNAFLDAFAEYRQGLVGGGKRQGRTLSLAWPLWREGGMRVSSALEKEMTARTGFVPLDTASGLEAFYGAMATGLARVTVLSGHRAQLEAYVAGLEQRRPAESVERSAAALPDSARLESLALEWLRREVAAALERPAHRLKDQEKFERYGMDSILAVQATTQLEAAFGSLPKTLFFEYQTLKELAGYFLQNHRAKVAALTGGHAESAGVVPAPSGPEAKAVAREPRVEPLAAEPAAGPGDIAIIGLSGRYPQAGSLAEFWANLQAGKDSITEVPSQRWDWREHFTGEPQRPGDHASKWGGFIEGVELFDPLFFNISPREAGLVDPQERLFLETVWNLLESTGYTRQKLRDRHQGRVAVYAGAMYQQYQSVESDPVSEAVVSLSGFSGIANRVSYFFDFQGPSVAVDTMCSSSLVAIQMACESLRSGAAELAIAGAVNLSIHPHKFTGLTAAKLMGSHPGSRSFAAGDGYLPAEGVGAVLLKPLAQAIREGDSILAVIKAVSTNHSGQSGGFGVPNPQAQAQAIEDCLRRAGVDPQTIGYVESSANGSPLGDAIELKALSNVWRKLLPERGSIPIGAVKANIGHAEAASGMAQVAKVVLQLRHGRLVPTLKPGQLNPNIRFEETPFRLQEEGAEWQRPGSAEAGQRPVPRRALICAVGAGGSTGHLVLEEYLEPERARAGSGSGPWLIVLSARNQDRLEAQARNLRAFLEQAPAMRLTDVAYTLHLGREAMEYRAALVVRSLEELARGLAGLTGEKPSPGLAVYVGNSEEGEPVIRGLFSGPAGEAFVQELLARREMEKLATYWVQGGEVRWDKLYAGEEARLVSLPTYPFERRRCWLPEVGKPAQSAAAPPAAPPLAPEPVLAEPDALGGFLQTEVARLLGLELAELPSTKALNLLGFTSIDAVSLKSKLEEAYAVEIPSSVLNAYQSLEQLESALAPRLRGAPRAGRAGADAQAARMQPVLVHKPAERYQPFPLSDIQESFYLGRKLEQEARTGCHIYFEIERAELEVYRLNAAWNRLVRRHEMLRAVLLPEGAQRILEETPPYQFRTVDLRRRSPAERAAFLARLREEMSHRVYEPERWPLFDIRVTLLPDRRVIHFSIDELIVDALSIELLFQEWQRWYDEPELALPELELSFRDYLLATKAFAASARAQKDLAYWKDKLSQMPSGPSLPGLDQAPAAGRKPGHRCTRLEGALPAESWLALKRRAEAEGASPTALVLCLFVEALRAQSREKDFSLILTFFNRMPIHAQVNQLLGPFISTSIFVAEAGEPAGMTERVRHTQRQLWEDLDHSSISGIRALRELKRGRHGGAVPSLPVVFTSMIGSRTGPQAALLKAVSFSVTQTPQVCLDHQLYEQEGGLYFSWDVATECFAPGAIDVLFRGYSRLLARAATDENFWVDDSWQRELPIIAASPAPWQAHPEDWGKPFPLTDQQQAYAFGRSAQGSQIPSNIYLEFESGELEVSRLEAAWKRVVQAHRMLATTIRADGMQQSLETVPDYRIQVQDFASLPGDALQEALASVERAMMGRLCPLGGWPFFELRLSRLGEGRMRVHFCVDMIIADASSIDCVAQELFAAYADAQAAPQAPGVTFQDYLRQRREARQNGELAQAGEYWNRKFAEIPPGPALAREAAAAAGKTYRLSRKLEGWGRLKEKAAEWQVQPAMILLAAYAEVLWNRVNGQPFTIVMPCWQRPPVHPDIYRVVGDFTTLAWLPVRELKGGFGERVIRCQEEIQADLAHGAVSGLSALRRQARRGGASGPKRLEFPVVFTDLSPQPAFTLPAGIRFLHSSSQTAQVHLDNISAEEGDALGLYWDVAEGVYPAGLIEGMFDDYGRLLTAVANNAAGGSGFEPTLKNPAAEPVRPEGAGQPGEARGGPGNGLPGPLPAGNYGGTKE